MLAGFVQSEHPSPEREGNVRQYFEPKGISKPTVRREICTKQVPLPQNPSLQEEGQHENCIRHKC